MKRVISLFLALSMLLALVPAMTLSVSATTNPTHPNPLCFTANVANSSIKLTKNGSPNEGKLWYSTNNKQTWNSYTFGDVITLTDANDSVYFAGDGVYSTDDNSNYYEFGMTGSIKASGSLNSILNSATDVTALPSACCFYRLFLGCKALTEAPKLNATSLTNRCYYSMFNGCTSLTNAPELPATSLTSYCYNQMFRGCTSLKKAPVLKATSLADKCYYYMFYGCSSLISPPNLPATALANSCYSGMFMDCSSLNIYTTTTNLKNIGHWNFSSNDNDEIKQMLENIGNSSTLSGSGDINQNGTPLTYTDYYFELIYPDSALENLGTEGMAGENWTYKIITSRGYLFLNNDFTYTGQISGTDLTINLNSHKISIIVPAGGDYSAINISGNNGLAVSGPGELNIKQENPEGKTKPAIKAGGMNIWGGNIIIDGYIAISESAPSRWVRFYSDAYIKMKGSQFAFATGTNFSATYCNTLPLYYGNSETEARNNGAKSFNDVTISSLLGTYKYIEIGTYKSFGSSGGSNDELNESDPETDIELNGMPITMKYGNESVVIDENSFKNANDKTLKNFVVDFSTSGAKINDVIIPTKIANEIGNQNKGIEFKNRYGYMVVSEIEDDNVNSLVLRLKNDVATFAQIKAMETMHVEAEVEVGYMSNGKSLDGDVKCYVPCDIENPRVFYVIDEHTIGQWPCEVVNGYCVFDRYLDGTYVVCK